MTYPPETKSPTHRAVPSDTARLETDGLMAGMIAGSVMFVAAMIASVAAGGGFLTPFRHAASIVMHEHAFAATPLLSMIAGGAVHISASLLFGHLFGLVASARRMFVKRKVRPDPYLAAFIGAVAGMAIWLVDIQLIARQFYPWLAAHTGASMLLHVVFFGAPLGVAFARLRERRARLGQTPTPYPNQAPKPTT